MRQGGGDAFPVNADWCAAEPLAWHEIKRELNVLTQILRDKRLRGALQTTMRTSELKSRTRRSDLSRLKVRANHWFT